MADKAEFESVKNYIDSMPDAEKTDDSTYHFRLNICKECDFLLAAMCRKCGCYVEIRAIGKNSGCPAKRW